MEEVAARVGITPRILTPRNEPPRYIVSVMLSTLGSDALELHEGFQYGPDEDRYNPEHVLNKFSQYCVAETNKAYESYRFNKCEQAEGESIETYLSRLRQLARGCNFGAMTDRMIRDRLVAGVREDTQRKKLLEERDLTLRTAIDKGKIHEATNRQLVGMGHEEVHGMNVKGGKKKHFQKHSQDGGKGSDEPCTYCNKRHGKGKEKCKAWGQTCHVCGLKNHFSYCCKTRDLDKSESMGKRKTGGKKKRVHGVRMDDYDSDEYVVLNVNDESKANAVYASMTIDNMTVSFQLDSGATTNCLSLNDYVKLTKDDKCVKLTKTDKKLTMYNGTEVRPVGERILDVVNPKNDKKYHVRFYILEGRFRPILGYRAVSHMKQITVNVDNIAMIKEESLLEEYSEVFQGVW